MPAAKDITVGDTVGPLVALLDALGVGRVGTDGVALALAAPP